MDKFTKPTGGCIKCAKCTHIRTSFFCGNTKLTNRQLYNEKGYCSEFTPKCGADMKGEPMSDSISRQAAIDEIHEDAEWLASQGSDWQVERMERDKSILMSLPSVQPETNCSEFPNNSDTISRQAAIDALEWKWAGKAALDTIKKLPPAQPSDSKIENAIRVLQSKYNKALSQDYIRNPIAWALYQTWKEFDR